jgi:hypothetical protein
MGKSNSPSRGICFSGSVDSRISRDSSSDKAFNASFITVGWAQLPPIQPCITPSAVIIALSPGLAEVGFSARTTTAVTNGIPFCTNSCALAKKSSYMVSSQDLSGFPKPDRSTSIN